MVGADSGLVTRASGGGLYAIESILADLEADLDPSVIEAAGVRKSILPEWGDALLKELDAGVKPAVA